MEKFDVTFQRKDHYDASIDWVLVDDVCAGERRVKSKKETYLPRLNPTDKSNRATERYKGFLSRAVFYNVTGRTLEGLIGTVFKKTPRLNIPEALEYTRDDINGHGVDIFQQSQKVLSEVLKKGRHCLFVDYPNIGRSQTKKEAEESNVQATVISINPEKVRNWRAEKVGSIFKYTLIVIEETKSVVTEDGFGEVQEQQFRVLRLQNGVYQVEVWAQNDAGEWINIEEYIPLDGQGKTWETIPFYFVGAENNDSKIDKAPLLDLANLNLAHYRDSAIYQDSVYYLGQPQPFMTGLNEEWRDYLEEKGIVVGSMSILPLPEGATFGFAQIAPNTLSKEAMDQKEEQMKGLGARVLQKGQAVKTATEAQNENESEHSVLSLAATNVSEAYQQVLVWVARFNNVPDVDIEFELNREFIDQNIDAQMLTALVGAWQAGRLPSSDFWDRMRDFGLVDPEKTNEELDGEVEESGVGLGLDDDDTITL